MSGNRPNFLFIMADQMAAHALPCYGNKVVKTPNLDALAAGGQVFDNSYCNFPLCAPSRFSMLTGQLCSTIGAYDNGAEFPASTPTVMHYLRQMGYHTSLSGKMHFVGPDQLHGYEERLVSELYPGDFSWAPDWEQDAEVYGDIKAVTDAGVVRRNMQIDHDEQTANAAVQKIFDLARRPDADERPFMFTVSFTHPHDPFEVVQEYWDRYDHDEIDMPGIPPIPVEELDVHSRGVHRAYRMGESNVTEADVRNARHGYYAAISYVDDKIGMLLTALEQAGLADDTVIVFTSDHGEMLGNRGLWYKKMFWDHATKVPLIFHAPGRLEPGRVQANVSLVDLLPTLVEMAGGDVDDLAEPVEGNSLTGLMAGRDDDWPDTVYCEVLSEGVRVPQVMIRQGRFKYMHGEDDSPRLFDLEADPLELNNLAADPAHAETETRFREMVRARWDLDRLNRAVLLSQRRRRVINRANDYGRRDYWESRTDVDATRQFVRAPESIPGVEREFMPDIEKRHLLK